MPWSAIERGPFRVDVRPHDPSWEVKGRTLADEIKAVVGPLALRVEHIGSTAIPGMAAEPARSRVRSIEDPVGDLVVVAAEQWALATGWEAVVTPQRPSSSST